MGAVSRAAIIALCIALLGACSSGPVHGQDPPHTPPRPPAQSPPDKPGSAPEQPEDELHKEQLVLGTPENLLGPSAGWLFSVMHKGAYDAWLKENILRPEAGRVSARRA